MQRTELMEHLSHGCSERVVVRVERYRVVGAAPWSEFLGGSEQRDIVSGASFDTVAADAANKQGGYHLEACRPGLIATSLAMHSFRNMRRMEATLSEARHPQRLRYDVRNLDPVAGSRGRTFSSDHFPLLMKCSSDYAEPRSDPSRLDGRGHPQRKGPLGLTISSTYIRS